jgi:hypothetical protein
MKSKNQTVEEMYGRAEEFIGHSDFSESLFKVSEDPAMFGASLLSKSIAEGWIMTREICRRLDTLIEIVNEIES